MVNVSKQVEYETKVLKEAGSGDAALSNFMVIKLLNFNVYFSSRLLVNGRPEVHNQEVRKYG